LPIQQIFDKIGKNLLSSLRRFNGLLLIESQAQVDRRTLPRMADISTV